MMRWTWVLLLGVVIIVIYQANVYGVLAVSYWSQHKFSKNPIKSLRNDTNG